jgi:hypothetical protein
LLAKLDKQIAADPATLKETDTVGETLAGLLEVLPNAPPSDAELVLAHCATRAREAKAGGRFDEAYFFVAVGDIVGDLVNGVALKDGVGPQRPKAEPPTTESGSRVIAAAPVLSPGDPANRDDASKDDVPVGAALAGGMQDAATAPPPGPEASPIQPQAALAGRAADLRPSITSANAPSANAPADKGQSSHLVAPATAQTQGATSLVALLAKLDKQMATDSPGEAQDKSVAETIADILIMERHAPPADVRLMLAMPVHFSNRAREAEAGGRHDEANRFATLAGLLEELFNSATPPDASTRPTPQQPKAERPAVVASANLSTAAAPAPKPLDPSSDSRVGDAQVQPTATTSPAGPTAIPGQPSAELAGPADDETGVAVGPRPADAKPAPPRAAEEPSNPAKNRPAQSDGKKPPQTPDLRFALREMPSTSADARPLLGTLLISPDRAVSPSGLAKAATAPGAPPRRVAVTGSKKVATSTVHPVDPQCRAIVLKFEIGEEPSDAERNYLRHGCRQHG